ncbi:MAG: M42 family metallopeptidase [Ruminococcaceae bacterium]|nr:M42 family metallopeptidase [Oscillospiraceae bacterium]
MKKIQELAFRFAAIPAPSGFAAGRLDAIAEAAAPYAPEIRRTPGGSLLLHRPGTGRKIALCTHVDDPGFLATYREESGAMRVNPLGFDNLPAAYGAPVVSSKGVPGVLSAGNPKDLKAADLLLTPFGEAETGDAFVLASPAAVHGDKLVGAGIAAGLSAAILLDVLADMDMSADLTLVFTGHHMLGARDAAPAIELAAPDVAVTLSALPEGAVKCGKGAAVCHQSGYAVSDPALLAQLTEAADEVQHDFKGGAVSDLSAIQRVGAGVPAAAIGYAVQDPGTLIERADLRDAEKVAEMLKKFLLKG